MRISIPEDHALLREAIRRYVQGEASLDQVGRWEADGEYPAEFFRGLADQGYFGLAFPQSTGGSGLGAVEMAIVGEELGRHGLDLAAGYGLTVFAGLNLLRHGSQEQVEQHLPRMFALDERYAIGITEPEAGSDAAAVRTSARREDGAYRVTGQKVFCTGAGVPDTWIHTLVRTDPSAERHEGLSVMLVPVDAPGVEVRRLPTVGRHMLGTYEVFFADVVVPERDRLGREGDGWSVITSGLELERVFGGAQYAGAASTALVLAVAHVNERRQFGRPLGRFQAVAHRLADVHASVEGARLLAYRAASQIDAGEDASTEAALSKLVSSEAFQEATSWGMQFMGGYGYTRDYPMERLWREARSATVTAGTSEIQRTIIARGIGVDRR